jgi:hypothetical protein
MTCSTDYAVFRTLSGEPIVMQFHKYLGPIFSLGHNYTQSYMPEYNGEEWNHLWKQFGGWMDAKGGKM